MSTSTEREYSSPDYKLIAFFRQSRDGWKQKAQQAKRQVWKLKERLKQVRARRDYWKAQALPASDAEGVETVKKRRSAGSGCPR